MHVRPLTTADFDVLHATFLQAFSDYLVPFALTADQLREMLRRRGYVPELSVGVFDANALIAFTCNGVGEWTSAAGERLHTLYDSGTGVVPEQRRAGLATRMFEALLPTARNANVRQYLLEVLEPNERACRLYTKLGFEITRRLQCWSRKPQDLHVPPPCEITASSDVDWPALACMRDVQPSWQNGDASIARAGDPHVALTARDGGATIGYALLFPGNGDLAQLAVSRSHRRRGVGRALLEAAASHSATGALRMINVDAANDGVEAFLRRCGATETVAQFEMSMLL